MYVLVDIPIILLNVWYVDWSVSTYELLNIKYTKETKWYVGCKIAITFTISEQNSRDITEKLIKTF